MARAVEGEEPRPAGEGEPRGGGAGAPGSESQRVFQNCAVQHSGPWPHRTVQHLSVATVNCDVKHTGFGNRIEEREKISHFLY